MPQEGIKGIPVKVRKYHIDTNHHVNNCQYVQMAVELLEENGVETDFQSLRVEYKKSAVYGDILILCTRQKAARQRQRCVNRDGKPICGD